MGARECEAAGVIDVAKQACRYTAQFRQKCAWYITASATMVIQGNSACNGLLQYNAGLVFSLPL